MSSIFGFDLFEKDIFKYKKNAEDINNSLKKNAEKMRDKAKDIATAKGLNVTGSGVSGIVAEHKKNESVVGWSERPNFHLYFHEIGFHALDNRNGGVSVKRKTRKQGRGRIYDKRTKATYIPPKPHMKSAFEEMKSGFYDDMQKQITK